MENPKAVDPTLVGIAIAVAEIRQSQEDFRRELLGNGQPGRIQDIEDKLEEHQEKFEKINKKHYLITGVIVAASHGLRAALVKLGII